MELVSPAAVCDGYERNLLPRDAGQSHLECFIIRDVRLNDVDVFAPGQFLRDRFLCRCFIPHQTDHGVVGIVRQLPQELKLTQTISPTVTQKQLS